MSDDAVFARLQASHREFLAMVEAIRPDLHRYCARMTGSVADGEDIVQDTLARAYYRIAELEEPPALRTWLFQIAHNRALDHLRRYERRMGQPLEPLEESLAAHDGDGVDPEGALARDEVVRIVVSRFLALAPAQRSCVVLKDVLGHSIEEIGDLLGLSAPAVKAALHRGRTKLQELGDAEPVAVRKASPAVARYAALFNARDWDGVRAMMADDVKLDLVARLRRAGRQQVSSYFTNYDYVDDWHLVPAWLDGKEVLAVFRAPQDERPSYFVELIFVDGQLDTIRDYRYVPYIGADARFTLSAP